MAINPLYIPLFNIEEVILDKDTGLPLAAGVVSFYRDSQRLTPKVVYQISGTSPNYTFTSVGSQLTLGLSGTFVDQNGDPFVPYAYPYDAEGNIDLYYVTVVSSGNVDQFTREAVPYVNSGSIPPSELSNTENEISNPQFVEVNIPTPGTTTVSVTGSNTVTPIAPGWDLISSGTGTIELERIQPTGAGTPTNPPYTFRILASSGLGSSVTLRQRFLHTPSIFGGNFCSGSMTMAVLSGGTSFVTMTYAPSTGTSTEIILSTSVPTDGAYHTLVGNAQIPSQANDPALTGYVDILITLPTSRSIAFTSIQVVGTQFSVDIPFDEETAARQIDHLFHYYKDATVHQPKESILAGWKFAFNPYHFWPPAGQNVANNTYTADQSIIIQQNYVDTNTGNNVFVGRSSNTTNYLYQVTAVTATNKFMLLQYVDPMIMRPYWTKTLSVMVKAFITTINSTNAQFKVRLMYKSGFPGTISQTVPVSAWSNTDNNIPTVSGDGWTFLAPPNDPTYTLGTALQSFNVNGFVLPASNNSQMTLGIAIIMMNNMSTNGTADVINFESISLVQNDFAIEADNDTYASALLKCQYYFEYSWDPESVIGLNTQTGAAFGQVASNAGAVVSLNTTYKTMHRSNSTITWYSPNSGTANNIYDTTTTTDFTVSSTGNASAVRTGYPNVTSTITDADTLCAHWTADSRLGV